MKNCIYILWVLLGLMISSCARNVTLTQVDSKFIILPEDFSGKPFDRLTVKPLKDGKTYFLSKGKFKTGEANILYSKRYYNNEKKEVKFQTAISILSNSSKAKKTYNGHVMGLSVLWGNYIKIINIDEYKVERAFCIESPGYFYLVIQRNKIVYLIMVDNTAVSEIEIRESLKEKLDYLEFLINSEAI